MKKRGWFGERFKIAVGGSLVALVVLAAIFAPLIAPWDPYQQDLMARLKPGFWSPNAAPGTSATPVVVTSRVQNSVPVIPPKESTRKKK